MHPSQYNPVTTPPFPGPSVRPAQGNGAIGVNNSTGQRGIGSPGSTSIRVKVAEGFQPPPPINFGRYRFEEMQSAPVELDFSLEKEILQDHESNGVGETDVINQGNDVEDRQYVIVDPWGERINQFVQLGHTREAVSLALAINLDQNDDKVLDFLGKYEHLLAMGFQSDVVTKALIFHNQDLEAATETCIASAGS